MKIKLDIDCSPEEARIFFGLPDVKPMQDAMMAEIQSRMQDALGGKSAEELMSTWLPTGMQGFESLQNMFFNAGAMGGQKSGEK